MNNKFFLDEIPAVLTKFPKFHVEERSGLSLLSGEIDLIQDDILEDSYLIEVHQTNDYPKRLPKVFEIGGRLPINLDWHVKLDGSLCLAAPPEEIIACTEGMSLDNFFEFWVKPYFYNQTFRKRNGYFYKERSHGDIGILESYQELLQIRSVVRIIEILEYVALHPEPSRTALCFCGNGEKYRKCHRSIFRTLKKIDNLTLLSHASKFRTMMNILRAKISSK